MSDVTQYKDAIKGGNVYLVSIPGVANPFNEGDGTFRRTVAFQVQNIVAANSIAESPIVQVQRQCSIAAISVTAPIAVTANATNFATITIAKRTAGGAAQTVATIPVTPSGSGNLVAFTPFVATPAMITYTNTQLALGDLLTITIAQSGTGLALTGATTLLAVSIDLEEV